MFETDHNDENAAYFARTFARTAEKLRAATAQANELAKRALADKALSDDAKSKLAASFRAKPKRAALTEVERLHKAMSKLLPAAKRSMRPKPPADPFAQQLALRNLDLLLQLSDADLAERVRHDPEARRLIGLTTHLEREEIATRLKPLVDIEEIDATTRAELDPGKAQHIAAAEEAARELLDTVGRILGEREGADFDKSLSHDALARIRALRAQVSDPDFDPTTDPVLMADARMLDQQIEQGHAARPKAHEGAH